MFHFILKITCIEAKDTDMNLFLPLQLLLEDIKEKNLVKSYHTCMIVTTTNETFLALSTSLYVATQVILVIHSILTYIGLQYMSGFFSYLFTVFYKFLYYLFLLCCTFFKFIF